MFIDGHWRGPTATAARELGCFIAIGVSLLTAAAPAQATNQTLPLVKRITRTDAWRSTRPSSRALVPRPRNPAAVRATKASAANAYQQFEQQRGIRLPSTSPRTAIFGGVDEPGLNANQAGQVTPPDTTGAIGPSDYVEMVNSALAVYPRDSTSPIAVQHESVLAPTGYGTCDGQVQWDQQSQRWLFSEMRCDNGAIGHEQLYFGWSKTSDPTDLTAGNVCSYEIDTSSAMEDYEKLGHNDSQLILGANEFNDATGGYVDSIIYAFNTPGAGDTSCPVAPSNELVQHISDFTPVPVNVSDSSSNGYVVALTDFAHIALYEVTLTGITSQPAIQVQPFSYPGNVPQPSPSADIDSSDARLTQAVALNDPLTSAEEIWTQHTVNGANGVSVIRWYELTPGATAPRQSGTITGPNGTFAFNGAISPTMSGGAAIFYNSGDAGHLVDLRVQSRQSVTSLGVMTGDVQLGASNTTDDDFSCSAPYGPPCRWGDYAGASPDPANPSVVWGTGEVTTLPTDASGDPQWGTINAAISVLPVPDLTTSAATGIDQSSATLNGTVNAQGYATSYHFELGPGTSYGSVTSTANAGAGTSPQAVSATVTGLVPGATYHYRLVATNMNGTAATADRMFTTAALPVPPANDTSPAAPLKVAILSGRIRVKNGTAGVMLSCSGGRPAAVCRGTLSITARVKRRVYRRVHGRRRIVTVTSTVLLAQSRYAMSSGLRAPSVLTLNPRGLGLVVHGSRRGITAQASATLTGTGTTRRTITMTK